MNYLEAIQRLLPENTASWKNYHVTLLTHAQDLDTLSQNIIGVLLGDIESFAQNSRDVAYRLKSFEKGWSMSNMSNKVIELEQNLALFQEKQKSILDLIRVILGENARMEYISLMEQK